MKKSYLKSLFVAFFTFFVVVSCDQQVDVPQSVSVETLLKDRDFLSFMSSAEELRYKVLYRQTDFVATKQVNGVSKLDIEASLKNADNSLEKIKQWAQTKEQAVKNKSLIVQELGFKNSNEYDQLEQDLQTKRGILVKKYPTLLSMSAEARRKLFTEVVEKLGITSRSRVGSGEWNVICPECFFNDCKQCKEGNYGKDNSTPWNFGEDDRCKKWRHNCKTIRDSKINDARAWFAAEVVGAGVTGYEIGSGVMAGSAPFIGPFAGPAGVASGLGSGLGIFAWAMFIYNSKIREIEAEYSNCTMDGPCT